MYVRIHRYEECHIIDGATFFTRKYIYEYEICKQIFFSDGVIYIHTCMYTHTHIYKCRIVEGSSSLKGIFEDDIELFCNQNSPFF
jgi:hypothetical protein